MRTSNTIIIGGLALAALASTAGAQSRSDAEAARAEARARSSASARGWTSDDDSDRAVIGVSTSSSGERDTLGLLITSLTPKGPAEKAGLEEGNRIASINGVNLRLSAADAGERDMNGLVTRRLVRELGKVKPGATVELRVWADGAYKTVKLTTVAADELSPRRSVFNVRDEMDDRPVLGLSLGGSGSRRDTLGILISALTEDGPAEKAGLIEGDRIQAINGVNVRVDGADAGDPMVSSAKASRFRRAMRDVKVGDKVELRVWSGGQTKTVTLTPVRAGDLYKEGRNRFFFGETGMIAPMPPMPPMAPMPPMPPRIWIGDGEMFDVGPVVEQALERVRTIAPRVMVTPRSQLQRFEFAPAPTRTPIARQATFVRAPELISY